MIMANRKQVLLMIANGQLPFRSKIPARDGVAIIELVRKTQQVIRVVPSSEVELIVTNHLYGVDDENSKNA